MSFDPSIISIAGILFFEATKATKKRTTEGACCTGEKIPVEEGPFCPAHPTHGFRRPWSH